MAGGLARSTSSTHPTHTHTHACQNPWKEAWQEAQAQPSHVYTYLRTNVRTYVRTYVPGGQARSTSSAHAHASGQLFLWNPGTSHRSIAAGLMRCGSRARAQISGPTLARDGRAQLTASGATSRRPPAKYIGAPVPLSMPACTHTTRYVRTYVS